MKLSRVIVYGILLVLIGAVGGYAVAPGGDVTYPDVIVPAARIIEREVPGEVRFRDRVIYRYRVPDVRATAPGGASLQVADFCAPTVAVAVGDTMSAPPRAEMIRSVSHSSSLFPLRLGTLTVTSATSYGDLLSRDYHTRDDFGIGSGDSVLVRYPRIAIGKEVARGVMWYAVLRAVEAVVTKVR